MSEIDTTPDNRLLLNVLKELRAEQGKQRDLLLQVVDYMRKMEQRMEARAASARDDAAKMERRLDERIVAVRDDLELMLKSELMGRLGHFETRIEEKLDGLIEELGKADD